MSSNSRMTRSKGPTEELSLPPTRMRKDVSTANKGEENAQGQAQANVQSQQRTVDMPSPFARPGSRAGTCTTPTSEGGMLPIASTPFARPNSREKKMCPPRIREKKMHKDRLKQMYRVSRGLLTCHRRLLDPDHGQALAPRPPVKEECCQ